MFAIRDRNRRMWIVVDDDSSRYSDGFDVTLRMGEATHFTQLADAEVALAAVRLSMDSAGWEIACL